VHGDRQLWIVDPSVHQGEDQGVATIVDGWPGRARVFRPGLVPGDGPTARDGHGADGVVVMGSAASVHDRLPWIESLGAWLRPLLDGTRPTPLLGICFGHQLVAHLAGAQVEYTDSQRTKNAGVETTRITGGSLLPVGGELRVIVSHRERVAAAPAGYSVVASRPAALVDGLEHERLPVFTFQFHPEAREEFALRADIDPALVDARVREDGRRVLEAFRRRVLRGR
jgi:GMP synthase (glutamine-hydrolysing)